KPASQQALTPASRKFVPLTSEQRKTLPKAKPISRKDSKRSPIFKTPSAEPTRAIREGWELCSIAFEYDDAYGEWTERTVTVYSVTQDHLKGECHLRHAERSFRLDRIMSDITDIDTGEILDVDDWVRLYA